MLRDLLVRAAGATVAAAIAISCARDDAPTEKVGQVQQLAAIGGAAGAADSPAAAGAPGSDGGAPLLGSPGEAGAGGEGPTPYVCGQSDCQGACQVCVDNVCVPRPSTYECRPASGGECDAPELCDGSSAECPTEERYKDEGTSCGAPPAGDCDALDTCSGTSKICSDKVKALGHVCRESTDLCDVADTCDGAGKSCVDKVKDSGVSCRSSLDLCDLEDTCDGTSKVCADKVRDAGESCRVAAGVCDVDDTCSGGTSKVCVDRKRPNTVKCQTATEVCDVDDFCDGATNDCVDTFKPSSFVCRDSIAGSDSCDPAERCTGSSATCPNDVRLPNQFDCTAASRNRCATAAACENGSCVVSEEKTCSAATECAKAGVCNRATGNCEVAFEADGKACDDGIFCSVGDRCQSGVCKPTGGDQSRCEPHDCAAVFCDLTATHIANRCRYDAAAAKGLVCRKSESRCDPLEQCNGVDIDCPADVHRPAGFSCSSASCANNQMQAEVLCDGSAYCPVAQPVSCDGYACDASQVCKSTCDTSADCIASHYCLDHVCERRVDPGKACESDAECPAGSAFCVDGVCCNTACKGQCEACNLPGKEGLCELVSGAPLGDRAPCRGDGSACNGTCDGTKRGQCTFPSTQTVCQEAACDPAAGAAVEQAFCDGAGSCAATAPSDCAPYVCGATTCRGDCVSDAQCTGESYCKAGKCRPLEEPGAACARDAQCESGFCTDGVCCEARCDGQCEACGEGGKCAPVSGAPVGARPACAGEKGDACAGACDGRSRQSCVYPGASVACREARCEVGVATVAASCAGDGRCSAAQTVACPNGCEGALCAGDACAANGDCRAGERCIAGTCAPQGEAGATCSSAADCGSGYCVDGVCCDRACDGQCEACDGAEPGVCAPVSGAPRGSRAPCTSDGSACGGACDGKRALGCAYPVGTVCAAGSCEAGDGEAVATTESQCNGSGRCPAPRQQVCGALGCDAKRGLCDGDCADGRACPSGKYCSAGVCVDDLSNGEACRSGDECASGHCVDGYCCGSACDDLCAACDVPGQLGKCMPVSGPTRGGRDACRGAGPCGATCDGKNVASCVFAGDEVSCSEPYCQAGVKVSEAACDGAGQCRAGEAEVCPAQACDAGECSDACASDADCSRSLQCREGKCVDPFLINAVDEGTCGCRAPGGAPARRGVWVSALLLAALGARRLRRRADA